MKIRKILILTGALFMSAGYLTLNNNVNNSSVVSKNIVNISGDDVVEVGSVTKYSSDLASARFMVDDTSVATITPKGYLKALKEGYVNVICYTKASEEKVTWQKTVNVVESLESYALTSTVYSPDQLQILDDTQSSTYNKYKGTQVMNDVNVNVNDVMKGTYGGDNFSLPVFQFKKSSGTMTFTSIHEEIPDVVKSSVQSATKLTNGVLASSLKIQLMSSYEPGKFLVPTVTFGGTTYEISESNDDLLATRQVLDTTSKGKYTMYVYNLTYDFGNARMGVIEIKNGATYAMYVNQISVVSEKSETISELVTTEYIEATTGTKVGLLAYANNKQVEGVTWTVLNNTNCVSLDGNILSCLTASKDLIVVVGSYGNLSCTVNVQIDNAVDVKK